MDSGVADEIEEGLGEFRGSEVQDLLGSNTEGSGPGLGGSGLLRSGFGESKTPAFAGSITAKAAFIGFLPFLVPFHAGRGVFGRLSSDESMLVLDDFDDLRL